VHAVPHGSDQPGQWSALVGRSAPAFQRLRSAVPPGPWKPFREQVSWLLLLLASKTAANRALVSRVQRTTLTPLAMQLENAERFAEQAAAVEAAAAAAAAEAAAGDRGATAAGRGWEQGGSSSRAAAPSPLQHHSRGSSRSGVADFGQQQQQHASPGRSPLPSFSSSSSPDRIGAAAAAVAAAGGGSSGRPSIDSTAGRTSVGPNDAPSPSPRALSPAAAAAAAAGGVSDVSSGRTTPAQRAGSGVLVPSGEDDLSMLQAEVAFLGLMSGQSSRAATADRDP
jgi:hypothetical protein